MRICTSRDFAEVLAAMGFSDIPIYIQPHGAKSDVMFPFRGIVALRDLNTDPKLVLIVD